MIKQLKFSMIGVGGYIAPRHLKAIKDTGNVLLASVDKHDSVGILDAYFPGCEFFTEFERFERFIETKVLGQNLSIDYFSICSPNYLHDSHIRAALRFGANAICEKPLVLNPWNIDNLHKQEDKYGKKIYTILQLRYHPSIIELKKSCIADTSRKKDIDLTYITSRGKWYDHSWKGDAQKSGGIATNIGIHFFDMLHFIFGAIEKIELHYSDLKKCAGFLEYKHARVRWFLSIDENDLPQKVRFDNRKTYRSIKINEKEFEFSDGFNDLHTVVYDKIFSGEGCGLEESRTSVEIVSKLRNARITNEIGNFHPLLDKIKKSSKS